MRKPELNKRITEYLSETLGKSKKTIEKNISLLKRKYPGLSSNAVAHIYAMKYKLSVLQKLTKEEKKEIPILNEHVDLHLSPKSKKKSYSSEVYPKKRYSNLLELKKIIRNASGFLWWIDKHFSKKGLEHLHENINLRKIKEIKVLMSINSNIDFVNFKSEFLLFKEELEEQGLKVNCRILCDKKIINKIHGRFIITKNNSYSVPPINSWLQGQYDQISECKKQPPFNEWWKEGKDLIKDWNFVSNNGSKAKT